MLRPAADAGPGSGSPRSSCLAAGASREFRAESSQSAEPGNTVSILVFSSAALNGFDELFTPAFLAAIAFPVWERMTFRGNVIRHVVQDPPCRSSRSYWALTVA